MDAINDIAKTHKLFVVEDNAECFLGRYKGRLVGTLGDCASFSFQSSKHVTSGEGGVLITQDLQLAENVRAFSRSAMPGLAPRRQDYQEGHSGSQLLAPRRHGMELSDGGAVRAVALAQVEISTRWWHVE